MASSDIYSSSSLVPWLCVPWFPMVCSEQRNLENHSTIWMQSMIVRVLVSRWRHVTRASGISLWFWLQESCDPYHTTDRVTNVRSSDDRESGRKYQQTMSGVVPSILQTEYRKGNKKTRPGGREQMIMERTLLVEKIFFTGYRCSRPASFSSFSLFFILF